MSVPRIEHWTPRPRPLAVIRMPAEPSLPATEAIARWLVARGVTVYRYAEESILFDRFGEGVAARIGQAIAVEDNWHGLAHVLTADELSTSYQRASDQGFVAVEQYALEYADGSRDEYVPGAKSELEAVEHAASLERFAAEMHTGDPLSEALVATKVVRRVVSTHHSDWVRVR